MSSYQNDPMLARGSIEADSANNGKINAPSYTSNNSVGSERMPVETTTKPEEKRFDSPFSQAFPLKKKKFSAEARRAIRANPMHRLTAPRKRPASKPK
jgi:hypothetical protein